MQRIFRRPRHASSGWQRLLLQAALVTTVAATGCAAEETGLTCGDGTEAKAGACVAKAGATALTCGADTVEKDGVCLPASVASTVVCGDGTREKDGTCIPKDEVAPVKCGPGTAVQDGSCVIDTKALMPKVGEVTLAQFAIEGDGSAPLMVLHDVDVELSVKVKGEAFHSMVVVGVRNADATKICTLGYIALDHLGGDVEPAAGAAPTAGPQTATYNLNKTMVVQPNCGDLIGEKGLLGWVAFDPFQDTNFAGRKTTKPLGPDNAKDPSTTAEAQIAQLLKDNALPLDGCKAGPTSDHPDTCTTSLTIVASAGIDLRLEEMELSSSVVVYEFADVAPMPIAATDTVVDGIAIKTDALDLSKAPPPVADRAPMSVNTQFAVYGLDPSKDKKFSDEDLGLTFAFRRVGAVEGEKWITLTERVEQAAKAGEDPVIDYLEKTFLKGLLAETHYLKDSPIYFTQEARDMLYHGSWHAETFFDLKICADGAFAEGGVDADPKANNCKVTQFVLVRREKSHFGNPMPQTDNVGGYIKSDEFGITTRYGNSSKIALAEKTKMFREWDSVAHSMKLGGFKRTEVEGWFPLVIVEERAWLDVKTGAQDGVAGSLTIFGMKFTVPTVPVPEELGLMVGGVEFNDDKMEGLPPINPLQTKLMKSIADAMEKTKDKEKFKDFAVAGPLVVTVGFAVSLTAALDAGIKKKTESPVVQTCDVKYGSYCYKNMKKSLSWFDAKQMCTGDGGALASDHGSQANHDALAKFASNSGLSLFWTSMRQAPTAYPQFGGYLPPGWPAGVPEPVITQYSPSAAWKAEGGATGYTPPNVLSSINYPYNSQFNNLYWPSGLFGAYGLCGYVSKSTILQTTLAYGGKDLKTLGSYLCGYGLPVVCEYPAQAASSSNTELSEVFAVIEPSITLEAAGYIGQTLAVVRGGVYAKFVLIKATLPFEAGMKWTSASTSAYANGALFVRLRAELSTLDGELGLWWQWWDVWSWDWDDRNEYALFEWDGYKTETTLFEYEFGKFSY